MKVIGIDLAGSEKRPTGVCLMNEKMEVLVKTLFLDEEIVDYVKKLRPELVAIDAPLSIPKGRKTIDDRSGPHLRKCDEELLRMGIKFFPITLGPMRKLTKSGTAGLIAALLTAVSPWSLFTSRIAVEANLAAFLFSLGK